MCGERFVGGCALVLSLVLVPPGSPLEGAPFIRGDSNGSGKLDISDGIRILGYLFLGNPAMLDCDDAADLDASGTINIGDAIYLLTYLFNGGTPPQPPFPGCGEGPGPESLGCATYPGCGQPTATAFELIDQALAAGEITPETALIYRVFHVYEDDRLPAAFRGGASPFRDTQLIADILDGYDGLSAGAREVLDPFLIPPAAEGSWLDRRQLAGGGLGAGGGIEWKTIVSPSGKVKVWSQTRYAGDDAQAAAIAGAVDGIWDKLVEYMKREPVPDGDVAEANGGDGKFDIYLVRIENAGLTHMYRSGFGCSKPNPVYMLVDGRETTCLLPTVAHELMHALQWTYAGSPRCPSLPQFRWWMEASATWAEDYIFRKDKNECQDATLLLSHPELPLDFSGSPYNSHDPHPYAAYLWPYFLDAATGTSDYVRASWDNYPTSATALEAIHVSLPDGFPRWWPLFAVYNWNDHPQYNYSFDNFVMSAAPADPATGEPLPAGQTFTPVTLNGQQDLHIPLFAKVQHLSSIYYYFTFPDDEVKFVSFEHFFDLETEPTARVQAMIEMKGDRDYTYEDWTETPVHAFCREHADQRLDNLVIIVTNSEWQNRTHVLDPAQAPVLYARNQCFSGAWSGTISNVNSLDEDITYHFVDGTFKIVRNHKTIEQRWDISPMALGRSDSGCETFVVNATQWTGSNTVDEYVEDHDRCRPGCAGDMCVETATHIDAIGLGALPSAFLIDRRCAETYRVLRATPGTLGAPPYSFASHPTSTTHVQCDGTFVIPLPNIEIREASSSGMFFDVTDPAKAQGFRGKTVDRSESVPPGSEGLSVLSNTWTWDLVREPD